MSVERTPSEVGEAAASEALVLTAAARELRIAEESIAVVRLAGDASTRGFFRVTHPHGSVVAVRYPWPFSAGDASTIRFERWCEDAPVEGPLTFANDPLCHVELTALLARFGVPVPAIVAIADRDGILFVEDLGDALLQHWLLEAADEERRAAYARAVDVIASVRAATEAALASSSVAGRLAFDAAKLGWELDFFLTNCFDHYLEAPLDAETRAAVREDCRALARALEVRPRVLCHRDYHARNLILRPGLAPAEGLVVIDFQDARMGPVTYDLVSLLEDPYTPHDAAERAVLFDRFAEALGREGRSPGEAALREEYDLMSVQRLLKAVGTYTHQLAVRGKRDYVPYIAPAVAGAAAALDRLGRYRALRAALDQITVAADAAEAQ